MQVPRVRFIGVRSSNGSSQAGWQARMEDMSNPGTPMRSDSWREDEGRPVSWQEYEEPSYPSYYDEATLGYDERYSAYEDDPRGNGAPMAMPVTPMTPEAGLDVAGSNTRGPSAREQPGWAVDDGPSRASTFTLASVYDDEEDVPPIPKTEKLAAAVRGMGQNGWAAGRI
jgi:hypothetical protein